MGSNAAIIEELKWKKFSVLNDGFVCLVDCMGDDAALTQAARVSYGAGTRSVSDDRTLIRYLLRHQHTTPFEMAELKFLVRVPMDCWRQWIRHRTASVNEYSTRYSLAINSMVNTQPNQWRLQSKDNRQGSSGTIDDADMALGVRLTQGEQLFQSMAQEIYFERINSGVAREQARKDLPLCTYTEAYWKIDLHNLLHFLRLRMEAHAQLEIREYATTIGEEIVAKLFPLTWEAFHDYVFDAQTLSRLDQGVIERLVKRGKVPASEETFIECGDPSWQGLERCRERDECRDKLKKLGLVQ